MQKIEYRQYKVTCKIYHPPLLNEFSVLWLKYGRREALIQYLITALFLIFWTIMAVSVPSDVRFIYTYPTQWWRVFFLLLAIGMTMFMIYNEYREYRAGKQSLKEYREWRLRQVRRDYEYWNGN